MGAEGLSSYEKSVSLCNDYFWVTIVIGYSLEKKEKEKQM